MISRDFIEEDLQLEETSSRAVREAPAYKWLGRDPSEGAEEVLSFESGDRQVRLSVNDVAQLLGRAVENLLRSKQEEDIYTEQNRNRVVGLAEAVFGELRKASENGAGTGAGIGMAEITRLIQSALARRNEHDLAKSVVIFHKRSPMFEQEWEDESPPQPTVRIQVIRRNRDVVPWKSEKVESAVSKAFLSQQLDPSPALLVARAISERVARMDQDLIFIEDLQDLVQAELMRQGHYKVAEAYILYRAHRSDLRARESREEERPAEDFGQAAMLVVQRQDGESYLWDGADLRRRIAFACIGLDLNLNEAEIECELRRSLYDHIREEDLQKSIVLNAKTLIERDADFARFAGRILLSYIYEEVLGWSIQRDGVNSLREVHRRAFKGNLLRGVELGRINPKMLDFDLDRLAAALDPAADLSFDYLGILTLYDRYLIVDKRGAVARRLETPQLFWMRVAMGLFLGAEGDREAKILGLYNLYKSRRFCSSTPTLFNSGTAHSQLSSCYLYKVDDSIESIMVRGIAENAFLSKWAGGLGGSWTAVRGTGSYIQGTNGESQGVIPFLKLHNDQLVAVNQGGKRRGSGCAYLETWHNDIEAFLELRRNTGDERRRAHDMNTANWIPDLFMKRLEAREQWTLFRSNEVPDLHELYGRAFEERYVEYEAMAERREIFGRTLPAIDLWKTMLRMLFETGHPWITFKDPCNLRSPQDHVGVVHSSNLCTEITLNTGAEETAVCNLGSVVLDTHLDEDGRLDLRKLRETVRIAVEALDNVIDINFYPTEAARRANMAHRPIGLGIMGLQHAFYRRGLAFASEAAMDFNDEIMEAVAYFAYEASSDLAAERGRYPTYTGSKWDRGLLPLDTVGLLEAERGIPVQVDRSSRMDWEIVRRKIAQQGMRNSNVLAIAPTATISNIMGSSPCIEPPFVNLYSKSNLSGDFTVLNTFLVRDLKALGLWDDKMREDLKYFRGELEDIPRIPIEIKRRYLTAFKIDPKWLIMAAARRQKWIDQSQSLNLFLDRPDLKVLSHMYRAAWHQGLKTTYYLRTEAASSIRGPATLTRNQSETSSGLGQLGIGTEEASAAALEVAQCQLDAQRSGGECDVCQ